MLGAALSGTYDGKGVDAASVVPRIALSAFV
jgi:hypothetical protein